MQIAAIIALVEAALALVERLGPALKALKQSTEMSPEQEAALDERISALRDAAHWKMQ